MSEVPCEGGGLPGYAMTIDSMACAVCNREMLRIPDAYSDGTVPEHDRPRSYHDLLDYDADWSDS